VLGDGEYEAAVQPAHRFIPARISVLITHKISRNKTLSAPAVKSWGSECSHETAKIDEAGPGCVFEQRTN